MGWRGLFRVRGCGGRGDIAGGPRLLRKGAAVMVAVVYGFANGFPVDASEKSFWHERRIARSLKFKPPTLLAKSALPPTVLIPQPSLLSTGKTSDPTSRELANAALPFDLADAVLPYGTIQGFHHGRTGAPFILLLQDVHSDDGAQKSIGRILSALSERGVTLAAVEGASGDLQFSSFRSHPSTAALAAVADHFRSAGYLSGPEWAGLTSPRALAMVGVETPETYRANVAAARASIAQRPAARSLQKTLREALDPLKRSFYSDRLQTLDRRISAYQAGTEGLVDHARFLSESLGTKTPAQLKRLVLAFQYEKRMDRPRVESDRQALLEKLGQTLDGVSLKGLLDQGVAYRAGRLTNGEFFTFLRGVCGRANIDLKAFPCFLDYLNYVGLVETIDRAALFADIERAQTDLLALWSANHRERSVWQIGADVDRLSRLLDSAMSSEDWISFTRRREATLRLSERLSSHGAFTDIPPGEMERLLRPCEDFCRLALGRNAELARNSLAECQRRGMRSAALVVGGFHTQGILSVLHAQGCGTVVVTPRIEKSEGGPLDIFARDPLPLEKLFAGSRIGLAPEKLLSAGPVLSSDVLDRSNALKTGLAVGANAVAVRDGADPANLHAWSFGPAAQILEVMEETAERQPQGVGHASITVRHGGGARKVEATVTPPGSPAVAGLETFDLSDGGHVTLSGSTNPGTSVESHLMSVAERAVSMLLPPPSLPSVHFTPILNDPLSHWTHTIVSSEGQELGLVKLNMGKHTLVLVRILVQIKGENIGLAVLRRLALEAKNRYPNNSCPFHVYSIINPHLFDLFREYIFDRDTIQILPALPRKSSLSPETLDWTTAVNPWDPVFDQMTGDRNIQSHPNFGPKFEEWYINPFHVRGKIKSELTNFPPATPSVAAIFPAWIWALVTFGLCFLPEGGDGVARFSSVGIVLGVALPGAAQGRALWSRLLKGNRSSLEGRFEGLWDFYRVFLEDLQKGKPDARVLDIGTGNGAVPWRAKEWVPGFSFVGADFADTAPSPPDAGFHKVQARAERLPFPEGSFDAATDLFSLAYTDVPRTVSELVRVLKPGAKAALVLHSPNSEIVRDTLRQASLLQNLDSKLELLQEGFSDRRAGFPGEKAETAFRVLWDLEESWNKDRSARPFYPFLRHVLTIAEQVIAGEELSSQGLIVVEGARRWVADRLALSSELSRAVERVPATEEGVRALFAHPKIHTVDVRPAWVSARSLGWEVIFETQRTGEDASVHSFIPRPPAFRPGKGRGMGASVGAASVMAAPREAVQRDENHLSITARLRNLEGVNAPTIENSLTESDRRAMSSALNRLSPRPFEGMPALRTLTLADWAGAHIEPAPVSPLPEEDIVALAQLMAGWRDADVRGKVERTPHPLLGIAPRKESLIQEAARSAAVLDELNHPWGENNVSVASEWIDVLRRPSDDPSRAAGDPVTLFTDHYNQVRRALWGLRFQTAELNRRSIKAIDITPLFDEHRRSERAAVALALELCRWAPAGGVTHLLVDWEGFRTSSEELDGVVVHHAETFLRREFPGLIRDDKRAAFRIWIRGTSAAKNVFRPDGISVRSLQRVEGNVALPLTLFGVALPRIVPEERGALADWLVSLVPIEEILNADLENALRRLVFLKVQA